MGDWERQADLVSCKMKLISLQTRDCRHHFWGWSILLRRHKETRTKPFRGLDEQSKVPWGLRDWEDGVGDESRSLLLFSFCQVALKMENSLIKTWIWRHNQDRCCWRAVMNDFHPTCKWIGREEDWKLPKDLRGRKGRENSACLSILEENGFHDGWEGVGKSKLVLSRCP